MPKPPPYNRHTERLSIASLPPEATAALEAHLERHGIELEIPAASQAVRTVSEPAGGGGLFRRRPKPTEIIAVLADSHLIVFVSEAGDVPRVLLRRLDSLDVTEYGNELVEDTGVNLIGPAVGGTERSSYFLPLDHGAAGSEFRAALTGAARPRG